MLSFHNISYVSSSYKTKPVVQFQQSMLGRLLIYQWHLGLDISELSFHISQVRTANNIKRQF